MAKRASTFQLLARLLKDARPYWRHLAGLFLLSLVATPILLVLPVPLKLAVDVVLGGHRAPAVLAPFSSRALLLICCALTFVMLLLEAAQAYGLWVYQLYVGERLSIAQRARLFEHVQHLPLARHDSAGVPALLYRLQNDVTAMQYVAVYGLIPFATTLLTLIGMFAVTWRIDPALACLALAVLPLLMGLSRVHVRRSRERWARHKESEGRTLAAIEEPLACIRVVKAFGQEAREADRYRQSAEHTLRQYLGALGTDSRYGLGVTAVVGTASAAAVYIGVLHVQAGTLTLGSFLLVTSYLAQLLRPLETLSKQVAAVQAAFVSAERIYALWDETGELAQEGARGLREPVRGQIEFDGVSFAHNERRPTLNGISFSVPAGGRVGIVGPTGAGKTTLVNLLLRFFDPSAGSIRIDGTDLREIPLSKLRSLYSLVLQEPVLFSTTIEENIAYGKPGATRAEIEAAAQAAGAHDFIRRLPHGYQTLVGERGMGLSGGERQRISIARAFLKNAPILILDEPTSSLDSEKELALRETLAELQKDRTTFTISHRPALLEGYEQILRLEEGRLA